MNAEQPGWEQRSTSAAGPPFLRGPKAKVDFAGIYRDHSSAVYGLARRICGPGLAAEVSQDVFTRLWTNPERFDPARGSLRSFLLAGANGRAIDLLRSEVSRQRREERTARFAPTATTEVDHELLEQARSGRLSEALGELPAPQRDAIVSAFYGERTYREAAKVLCEPEGTIKSRIRVGLAALRDALGDFQSAFPAG